MEQHHRQRKCSMCLRSYFVRVNDSVSISIMGIRAWMQGLHIRQLLHTDMNCGHFVRSKPEPEPPKADELDGDALRNINTDAVFILLIRLCRGNAALNGRSNEVMYLPPFRCGAAVR